MQLGLDFIPACEAVLRVPGESAGADRECAFAEANGIPVFHSIESLIGYRDQNAKVRELAADVSGLESTPK